MFNKFFKKETATKEVVSGVPETTDTQEIPIQDEQYIDDIPTPDEPMFDDLTEDDFDVDLNVDDVGIVESIDEEAMKADLTKAIREELLQTENIDDMQQKVADIENQIGITQDEWDEKYNNIDLLGYESRQQQAMVFGNVLPEEFDAFNDTLLDIGCGVGDLYAYIQEVIQCSEPLYQGVDSDSSMLELAKGKFPELEDTFEQADILTYDFGDSTWDWVVAMSAFNIKIDVPNQTEYVKNIIKNMYSIADKGIAINLMHSYPEGEDWSNDMVTFDSAEIFKWAIENFYNVKAHRNYIDRDFILYIYK
jgi:SAM-dependent methyltransferase